MSKVIPKRALGRGLDALLPTPPSSGISSGPGARTAFTCPIERVVPRRDQPRQYFDAAKLDELAATIAEHGIIQPLVVRRLDGDRYEIIAGERRWRAAQRAGKKEVPVVVKDVSSEAAFVLALIENLHRDDLNPIEVAEGYARLCGEGKTTQERVAEQVGKSRVAVTNALRLLKLPESVRAMVASGELSEGHGRALLGAEDAASMLELGRQASRMRINVRRLEALVRARKASSGGGSGSGASGSGASGSGGPTARPGKSASVRDLEQRLTRRLGTRVSVEHDGAGGKFVVSYASLDELDRILLVLGA